MNQPCDPLYLTETAYRKNRKVRANPKTRPRIFFAVNDPVYHSGDAYNGLFYKGKSAVNRGLNVGGHILLSMRLYANNDAGNILWEWAFDYLALYSLSEHRLDTGDTIFIPADEVDDGVQIEALLIGFANRDPKLKTPQTVKCIAPQPTSTGFFFGGFSFLAALLNLIKY